MYSIKCDVIQNLYRKGKFYLLINKRLLRKRVLVCTSFSISIVINDMELKTVGHGKKSELNNSTNYFKTIDSALEDKGKKGFPAGGQFTKKTNSKVQEYGRCRKCTILFHKYLQ